MKAGNAPMAGNARIRQQQQDKSAEDSVNGKRGFRRRIQFRQATEARPRGAGRDEALSRATALDEAQEALELFYASFPVVPLLSVPHAKVDVWYMVYGHDFRSVVTRTLVWSARGLIGGLIDCLIGRSIDCLLDCLIAWLVGWWVAWLIFAEICTRRFTASRDQGKLCVSWWKALGDASV